MSKAFNKVWHKGLIFKLKFQNGRSVNLLSTLVDFLKLRKRVVLNDQLPSWINTDYPCSARDYP